MNTLEILERLIAFPTVSSQSNLAMIDFIQSFLRERGFETDRVFDKTGQKAGLFARIGPSERAGILLSGHTDVVTTEGQNWMSDPFVMKRDGAKIFGRGVTDMKGYLASMMTLADNASRTNLVEPLKLVFSYDEEVGCLGMKSMIDHLKSKIGLPKFAFVGEPTSMKIATGHKGKMAMRAICKGQSGHSALAPNYLNAVYLAIDFVFELRKIQTDFVDHGAKDFDYEIPYSTVHVGKISGGVALNIVPEETIIDFEVRHLPLDIRSDVISKIDAVAEKVCASYRPTFPMAKIEIECVNSYPGLETDVGSKVVVFAQKKAGAIGTTKVDFGTEAGYFAEILKIPTIICGPGSMDQDGHQPNESLELSQLEACDTMHAGLLSTFLS